MKTNRTIQILLVSLFLIISGAAADTIQVQSIQVDSIGATMPVEIILDTSTAGIAGYDINISLSDPSKATITEVSFPQWAVLNESTVLPSPSVRLRTVDLSDEIGVGAIDVPFGTITIRGDAVGSTDVIVTIKEITADNGDSVVPDIESGMFTVDTATGSEPIIANHTIIDLSEVPKTALDQARSNLHIAYGHTSHGSQVTTGMTGLETFPNAPYGYATYLWSDGIVAGQLDLDDYFVDGDLGNPDRTTWAQRTRDYLDNSANSDVNVVMWSWCGQVDATEAEINTYLNLMNQLESDYPDVTFVYMTGHLNGGGADGNVNLRNEQIRNYVRANNKVLYDFADIESYDPDGLVNYMELLANDNCDYDSDGDGSRDANWALDWQDSHTEGIDWYSCSAAHSQALNGNQKAYAAWWLWARLAGWDGTPAITTDEIDADVISNNIPVTMTSGQSYPVTVTVENTGTMIWNETSRIRLGGVGDTQGDAVQFGSGRIRIADGTSVAPGEQYTFSFTMKAPATTGTYEPSYRMVWDGHKWFGDQTCVTIQVTSLSSVDAEMVSHTIPDTMVGGQSYPVTVTVENTGSMVWNETSRIRLGGVGDTQGDAVQFGSGRIRIADGTSVAPGEQYTFSFTMKAPATTGTYEPSYRMVWDGHKWFGDQTCVTIQVTSLSSVDAEMVSHTIPDTMVGGQSYPVTVTVENTGMMIWNETSRIRLGGVGDTQGDAVQFGSGRIRIADGKSVAPGEQYTFSFTMKAPATTGTYEPSYRMVWDGHKWFGEQASATVEVTSSAVDAEMISHTIPDTMVGGQSYPVTVTVENTGTMIWNETSRIRLGGVGDSQGDAVQFGSGRIRIADGTSVAPGEQYTFSFTMKAPATTGTYEPSYRMVWDGHKWFGDQVAQSVQVT